MTDTETPILDTLSQQVYANSRADKLYSEQIDVPERLPLSIRKALGDRFYETDPASLGKEEHKQYLMHLKQIVIAHPEAGTDWGKWMRLPHFQGEKQLRKGHSQNTLFDVFNKLYKAEQAILNEAASEQAESQTAPVRTDPSSYSEEGEVPPTSPPPTPSIPEPPPQILKHIQESVSATPVGAWNQTIAQKKVELLEQEDDKASSYHHRRAEEPGPIPYTEVLDFITRTIVNQQNKRK